MIFLDRASLWNIVQKVNANNHGSDIMADVLKKMGAVNTIKAGFNEFISLISTRKFADAAVGRAKNHAKMLGSCIGVIEDYYKNPEKIGLFEEEYIDKLLRTTRYTDLAAKEVKDIASIWSESSEIKVFYVPGRPQMISGVSYWIASDKGENYFNTLINNRNALVT